MRKLCSPRQVEVPLTKEQLKGMLRRLDTNGDGKISRRELRVGLKSLGLHFAGVRAIRALSHADANGDGVISDEEINELAKYVYKWGRSSVNLQPSSSCLIRIKKNELYKTSFFFSSHLSLNMRNTWSWRQVEVPLTEEQLKGMLRKFDTDGDGKISRRELRVGLRSLGLRFTGVRVIRALRHADANGDGVINDEEINKLAKYVYKWGICIY
ncbi:uncharacterized protein LOC143588589 [Bidens hawaiensis]|uniref:uncharacterized protein LOC143588589 n=1 Tax=Bidens hawaiensis TaxID=980011 RepID=UPI004049A433